MIKLFATFNLSNLQVQFNFIVKIYQLKVIIFINKDF